MLMIVRLVRPSLKICPPRRGLPPAEPLRLRHGAQPQPRAQQLVVEQQLERKRLRPAPPAVKPFAEGAASALNEPLRQPRPRSVAAAQGRAGCGQT